MLMQTCKECVLKCNQETLRDWTGNCFCVFQYMELSVPECEEEGLFYCDCTKYTGIPRCHSGMNLKEYFYKVLTGNAIEVIPPQFVGYQSLFPSIFKCYWGIHLDFIFTFNWMNLIFDWNNIDKADIFWNLLINGLVTDGFFCSD